MWCCRSWWLLSNLHTSMQALYVWSGNADMLSDGFHVGFHGLRIIPYFIYVMSASVYVILNAQKIFCEFYHSSIFRIFPVLELWVILLLCFCCLFCISVISHAVLVYPNLLLCTNKKFHNVPFYQKFILVSSVMRVKGYKNKFCRITNR